MFGLAGLGDLIATSESSLSRNFRAGEMLGQGMSGPEVLESMNQVAEGLGSLRPVLEIAGRLGIEMPIVSQVEDVVELTVYLLRGLVMQEGVHESSSEKRRLFELWKQLVIGAT